MDEEFWEFYISLKKVISNKNGNLTKNWLTTFYFMPIDVSWREWFGGNNEFSVMTLFRSAKLHKFNCNQYRLFQCVEDHNSLNFWHAFKSSAKFPMCTFQFDNEIITISRQILDQLQCKPISSFFSNTMLKLKSYRRDNCVTGITVNKTSF